MKTNTVIATKPAKAEVLTEAVLSAALQLEVKQAELADILGVSPSTASRLFAGNYLIETSRVWDAASTFILVYRSLASILGSNRDNMKAWLKSHNRDLGDVPMKLLLKPAGLHQVRSYLDAYRGRC